MSTLTASLDTGLDASTLAADRLWEAAASGIPCEPVRTLFQENLSVETAYQIQQIVTGRHIAAGRKAVGCKIGLTSLAVQAQLGVDQPDFGILFEDMQVQTGAVVPRGRTIQAKVEAEVAFVLSSDLTGDLSDRNTLLNAIDYAVAAIEIVDSRIRAWDIRLFDTISDNASSGLFVLGTIHRHPSDLDLQGLKMRMVRAHSQETVSQGSGADGMGDPLEALRWLASTMNALGRPLLRGDIVLSGALGPMAVAHPGDHFTAEIDLLGEVSVGFAS
jgi:2-keto-4-pentenoate hydratase